MTENSLTGSYSSPTETKTFTAALPTLTPPTDAATESVTVEAKTAYLAALRASLTQMQADVNEFLTAKMAEDQTNQSNAGKGGAAVDAARDLKEEENYGEEDPENDG